MPFPPNYNLERNNRAKAKAQKLAEKAARREEKRKAGDEPGNDAAASEPTDKDAE
jgi:hypothetical protein